jgi:glucose 1-dehydrogenase
VDLAMGMLDGKVAVITGSTKGLGLAIARAYAREGARVVISSRSSTAVVAAVADLQATGAQVAGMACDVADLAQVEKLATFAVAQFGRFDIWVNNAALSAPYGPVTGISPEAFTAATKTNVLGTYNGSLVAMRHFLPRRQGKLINLTGAGATKPVPFQAAYASSKAWIRNFTLALAKEHAESGVGVFALQPGLMLTDLVTNVEVVPGWEERVMALPTVLRLLGNPPEVPAERALWIASSATDGRTGQEFRVLTAARMLKGLLREGVRRLTGRKAPEIPFEVRTVHADPKD